MSDRADLIASEVERSLVCGAMAGGVDLEKAASVVAPDDFILPEHRRIFFTCVDLFTVGGSAALSLKSVVVALRKSGLIDELGGSETVANMIQTGRSERHSVLYFADQLAKIGRTRRARAAISRASAALEGGSSWDDEKDGIIAALEGIQSSGDRDEQIATGPELHQLALESLQSGRLSFLPTRLEKFDKFYGGLSYGGMTVLAARTSIGKTAVAADIAARVAESGRRVLFVSMEMSLLEMGYRYLARASGVDLKAFRTEAIQDHVSDLESVTLSENLSVWVRPRLQERQLRAMVRRMKAEGGLDLVVVDYLGLMGGKGEQYERTTRNSAALKELAVEQDVAMLVLSQLNREAEKSAPTLANLAQSGAIEQDADMVIFLERDRKEANGLVTFTVAKNRSGCVGKLDIGFRPEIMRLVEYEGDGLGGMVAVGEPSPYGNSVQNDFADWSGRSI